jgi:hypothetical protein
MSKFNAKEIKEINDIIAAVAKVVKSKSEIGARDKVTLNGLLATNKIEKSPVFFKCRKEYSEAIVNHFVREKSITRNKFHMASQGHVYVIN